MTYNIFSITAVLLFVACTSSPKSPDDALATMQDRITPLVRRRVDFQRANHAGRLEEVYAASVDILRLSRSFADGDAAPAPRP